MSPREALAAVGSGARPGALAAALLGADLPSDDEDDEDASFSAGDEEDDEEEETRSGARALEGVKKEQEVCVFVCVSV